METSSQVSHGRRLAAAASLAATGASLGVVAVLDHAPAPACAFAGLVVVSGLALAHRSVLAQVLARGPALIVAAVGLLVTIAERTAVPAALASGAVLALLLARPMLATESARAEFAPLALRRPLLAAATAEVTAAVLAGGTGFMCLGSHQAALGLTLVSIAGALLASAIGVIRMRAWGVLLGGATSFAALAAAAVAPHGGELLLFLAIPGVLLGLLIALARLGAGRAGTTATPAHATSPAVRLRFAGGSDESVGESALEQDEETTLGARGEGYATRQ